MHRRAFILAIAVASIIGFPALSQAASRLNPNTATAAQLAKVPGLDPKVAEEILKDRPFATMVEFDDLVSDSLSDDKAEALYERLFIPVNLNTASEEEIELIPGMDDHMLGEFLEYRPYDNMETFNREIGKYVDDAEVARLRSYVTL